MCDRDLPACKAGRTTPRLARAVIGRSSFASCRTGAADGDVGNIETHFSAFTIPYLQGVLLTVSAFLIQRRVSDCARQMPMDHLWGCKRLAASTIVHLRWICEFKNIPLRVTMCQSPMLCLAPTKGRSDGDPFIVSSAAFLLILCMLTCSALPRAFLGGQSTLHSEPS